jgi:hypothetical protein
LIPALFPKKKVSLHLIWVDCAPWGGLHGVFVEGFNMLALSALSTRTLGLCRTPFIKVDWSIYRSNSNRLELSFLS